MASDFQNKNVHFYKFESQFCSSFFGIKS